ncbi:MAG: hypothetical protein COT15_02395 [Candidatus Diapherotrites archaeon CG08_land_8_20_14_0_20_34_12]|nr:MAG: hypothetical protein COT15_02395 [Candidatus Diapherotrites archaeon CG08_land_8_20_14_0_20_34_12]
MAARKDKEFKDFLVSKRKSIKPGISSAPVWVFQKANKRIWNPVQKRHWKDVDFGKKFEHNKVSDHKK